MKHGVEQLKLGETYDFNVVVVDNHGKKFGGRLSLSPKRCMLIVSGEISPDREADFAWESVDQLVCSAVGTTFILLNLKSKNAYRAVLERHPKVIQAFEISYEIEYVICTRSQFTERVRFSVCPGVVK